MSGETVEKPTQDGITDLSNFILKRMISINNIRKTICVEGTFTDREGVALLFLEKNGTNYETVKMLLSSHNCVFTKNADDTYDCNPGGELSALTNIKLTLVFPATERHIKKYEVLPFHLIKETPELYYDVTLPCIMEGSFNIQWVYNILSHEAEQDRIIFEDPDPKTGFIFLPDLKWNQSHIENLYMMAIVNTHGIKSLRDVTADHLPLLRNIKEKGTKVIKDKYNLSECQLRIYIHYQPSYYHFHVHFTNIEYGAPGIMAHRSHLLDTVINNLEIIPDYYQKSVLCYTVKEMDNLYQRFKLKGLIKDELKPKCEEQTNDDLTKNEVVTNA